MNRESVGFFVCVLLAFLLGRYLSTSTRDNNNNNDNYKLSSPRIQSNTFEDPNIQSITVLPDVQYSSTTSAAGRGAATNHNTFDPTVCGKPVPSEDIRHTILDLVFNGKSPWVDFPPPHVDNLLRKKWVKGWGSKDAVFENLIKKVKPKTIIEVGTFLGASALHMVDLTRKYGLNDTQVVCVDDFRGWPGFLQEDWFKGDLDMVNGDVTLLYQFMQNVVSADATESVTYLPFNSGLALEKMCEWGLFAEMVEVDAGHDFHSAWSDINRAFKLVKPGPNGGVLFGHDYFTEFELFIGVKAAADLFAKIHNFTIEVDGYHWVIHIPPNNGEVGKQ